MADERKEHQNERLAQFERLVVEHQTGVWRYLRLLGCEPERADELTQDVFLNVYQRPFDNYDFDATASYLRSAARFAFLSALRKDKRRKALKYVDAAELVWIEQAGREEGNAQLDALDLCWESLEQRERDILTLRYRDDLSREELAKAFGISEDGAKNVLQRAKARLRECIERRMEA